MTSSAIVLIVLAGSAAAMLRDVPKGECHDCEVTCFEDCALKYDREIIQPVLLQTKKVNKTVEFTKAYSQCLIDDQCPCNKAPSSKALLQTDKKKGKCAVNAVPCASNCGQKAINAKKGASALLQKDFPLHPVTINAFAKGAMNMDQCLKYCLAATCGCEDAPGFEKLEATVKANAAAGTPVKDLPAAPQYKPAKIEECAKGMIGKKVASGLYIKLGGGPMDYVEVCTPGFLSAIAAPEEAAAKCKSAASDDSDYGCVWSATKNTCVVGFSPILKCMTKYINDPTP
jgi:hypothetical protein